MTPLVWDGAGDEGIWFEYQPNMAKRKNWRKEDMVYVFNAVRGKNMGYKAAARLFHVPRATIKGFVKLKLSAEKNGRNGNFLMVLLLAPPGSLDWDIHCVSPPHFTDKQQSLDVAFMFPFKTYYTKAIENWLANHPGHIVRKLQVASPLAEAYFKVTTVETDVNGFKKTSNIPFKPDNFSGEDFIVYRQQNNNQENKAQLPHVLISLKDIREVPVIEPTLLNRHSSTDSESLDGSNEISYVSTDNEDSEDYVECSVCGKPYSSNKMVSPAILGFWSGNQIINTKHRADYDITRLFEVGGSAHFYITCCWDRAWGERGNSAPPPITLLNPHHTHSRPPFPSTNKPRAGLLRGGGV
uniref:(California timema) hypothetical protein n=1 Tax=Timema californicum TaxID=61474 RepID=A0A7R9J347_TIMCA|nr:unnamed protein product [Timema californicum]